MDEELQNMFNLGLNNTGTRRISLQADPFQAMQQQIVQDTQGDPYYTFATNLSQAPLQQADDWKTVLANALMSGAKGISQGYAQQRLQDRTDSMYGALGDALGGKQGALAAYPKVDAAMGGYMDLVRQKENEIRQKAAFDLMGEDRKLANQKDLKQFEFNLSADKDKAKNEELARLLGGSSAPAASGKRETLAEMQRKAVLEGLSLGLPGGAAQEYAAKKVGNLTKDASSAYKDIEDKRAKAQQLANYVEEAKNAITLAGNTGGFAPGLKRAGDYVLGATDKMQGDVLLDKLSQESLAMNRIAGSGAMSDFESKALFGAGINKDRTPQENTALLGNLERVAAITKEHADFLDNYLQTYGHTQGAQQAWESLKAANPIVIKDQSGQLVVNPNRKSFRDLGVSIEQLGDPASPISPVAISASGAVKEVNGVIYKRKSQ